MICNDTAIKNPRDHGVSCVSKLLAKPIGDQIEDGVQKAINFFENTESQPVIRSQLLWEVKDQNDQTNYRGDFRSFHGGQQRILDVTFTSTDVKSVDQLEEEKTKVYEKRFKFPENAFIPVAIKHTGEWGKQMTKYFYEAVNYWIGSNGLSRTDSIPELNYSKQQLSLAICRANYQIMYKMRTGSSYIRKSRPKEALAGKSSSD